MVNFLKNSENIAHAIISGGVVVHCKLADFEALLEQIAVEHPEIRVVYRRISVGKLWIKEGEAP
jgi:hypothetical protein